MKNIMKVTLGTLLFSGLFFFNFSDRSSNENSDFSMMSIEQISVYAQVTSEAMCRDPFSEIDGYCVCYNQMSTECKKAKEPDPVVVVQL